MDTAGYITPSGFLDGLYSPPSLSLPFETDHIHLFVLLILFEMLSYNIFALFGAAILPLASAAPFLDSGDVDLGNKDLHARNVDVYGAAKADAHIHAREVTGVASILVDLQVNLGDAICDLRMFAHTYPPLPTSNMVITHWFARSFDGR